MSLKNLNKEGEEVMERNECTQLIDNIRKNMEYLKLLLIEGHQYAVPLNTYNLIMKQLDKLREMLVSIHLVKDPIVVRRKEVK